MSKEKCQTPQEVPRPSLIDRPAQEKALLEKLLAGIFDAGAPVEQAVAGGRFAAVRAAGRVGLASVLGSAPGPGDLDALAGLKGKSLQSAAGLILDDSPFKASLGLAALNAGFAPPPSLAVMPAGDLLPSLSRDKRVVVVGDFPFAQDLRETAASLAILDLRPGHGSCMAEQDAALADSQVAAISSTALLTRSLAGLLKAAQRALKILVGPSTPWAPVLFDLGADVLAGSIITNPAAVMEAVAQDLPFYQIKQRGVRLAIWPRPGLDLGI
jgi:hypothetical protein